MNSSDDLYENNPPTLYSPMCKVSDGSFLGVAAEKAVDVTEVCDPLGRKIVSCANPYLEDFIDEVGGNLELDIPLPAVNIDLPTYIPILDGRTAHMSRFSIPAGITTLGLTFEDVLKRGVVRKAGAWHEQKDIEFDLTARMGDAFHNKKVIFLPSGPDTMIEWLWFNRDECSMFRYFKAMNFDLITGINFSVIKGECPCGQCLNQKKSLLSAKISSDMGIPAIPHIYTIDKYDIEAWAKYLEANPQVRLVAMNCQLQKRKDDIEALIKAINTLMSRFPDLRFLLTGFHLNRAVEFGSNLERIHFADKSAVKEAQAHMKFFFDYNTLRITRSYHAESVESIASHNMTHRRMYIELLKRRTLAKYRIPDDVISLIKSTFHVEVVV